MNIVVEMTPELNARLTNIESMLQKLSTSTQMLLAGDPEERLKSKQVAKMLNMSTRTLYDWRQRGLIAYEGHGNNIWFRRGTVIEKMRELNIPALTA